MPKTPAKKNAKAPGAPKKKKRKKRPACEGKSSDSDDGADSHWDGSMALRSFSAKRMALLRCAGFCVCVLLLPSMSHCVSPRLLPPPPPPPPPLTPPRPATPPPPPLSHSSEEGGQSNTWIEDFNWNIVYKCHDCDAYGHTKLHCEACGSMRAAGILQGLDSDIE